MEQKGLQVFDFESRQVRIVLVDGEPVFVCKDVVEATGAIWNGEQNIKHVPEEWKGVISVMTPGGMQQMTGFKEQGLYFYLARSDKPAALPFQKKIAGEIMPSIRKHGMYTSPQKAEELFTNPDNIMTILQNWKKDRDRMVALEAKVEADHPKVLFADSVAASDDAVLIRQFAKQLAQNGFETGERRFYETLRQDGFLIKKPGGDRNTPSQRAMEMGLFNIKETAITHSDGKISLSTVTKISGKGQVYFTERYLGKALGKPNPTAQVPA